MVDEPEDERLTDMKRRIDEGYLTQTRLDDKRFLPERNPEHPNHLPYRNYYETKDGEPYSTNDVLADPYHWDYGEHPYSRSLGHLFG